MPNSDIFERTSKFRNTSPTRCVAAFRPRRFASFVMLPFLGFCCGKSTLDSAHASVPSSHSDLRTRGGRSAHLVQALRGGADKRQGRSSPSVGSPGECSKRATSDTMKLMMSNFKVKLINERTMRELQVLFHGPKGTPYENGVWRVNVELPLEYPYKSPSIGFGNRIYHPNVDEASGSVCLDVINQTWKPIFDLLNIFEVFLPQLLTYPNPSDPLNAQAAALAMREPAGYEERVREYVRSYCQGIEAEFLREIGGDNPAGRVSKPAAGAGKEGRSSFDLDGSESAAAGGSGSNSDDSSGGSSF